METQIPHDWLEPVLKLLRVGRFEKDILVPRRVQQDWDADTLGAAFISDLREPLIAALSVANVSGKLIGDQPEPGVTYAFWFHYKRSDGMKKFYGKICFHNNKVTIKVLSAHLPNKGNEQL